MGSPHLIRQGLVTTAEVTVIPRVTEEHFEEKIVPHTNRLGQIVPFVAEEMKRDMTCPTSEHKLWSLSFFPDGKWLC